MKSVYIMLKDFWPHVFNKNIYCFSFVWLSLICFFFLGSLDFKGIATICLFVCVHVHVRRDTSTQLVQLPSNHLVALTFGCRNSLLPWIPLSSRSLSIFIFSPFLPSLSPACFSLVWMFEGMWGLAAGAAECIKQALSDVTYCIGDWIEVYTPYVNKSLILYHNYVSELFARLAHGSISVVLPGFKLDALEASRSKVVFTFI